nr:hypothetical protein [Tanacetum cinerariifolium]
MMHLKGFFFFKFASIEGKNEVLENGPWFIRFAPIILKKWKPNANLLKEDLNSVPIWVKFLNIPIVVFTAYELSVDRELKEDIVIDILNVKDDGEAHFKPKKPVWQVVSKKNSASSSGTEKNSEVFEKVASSANSFDALNTIEEADELGSNGESYNSGKKVIKDVDGLTFGYPSNSPLVARINEMESQMIKRKKPLKHCKPTPPSSSYVVSIKNSEVSEKVASSANSFDALNTIEEAGEIGSNGESYNSGKKVIKHVAGSTSGNPTNSPLAARMMKWKVK